MEHAPVLPACDNMITPSLETTSCSSAGDFEPVSPSVLSRGAAPLLPLVSAAFTGKQPRGSCLDRLVPDLPPADFFKHALSVTVHPMSQPCPLPSRLVNTIVSAAKLAEDLVAHRWELFDTVLKNIMNFLLRAKLGGQVFLAIRLLYLGVGIFPFFNVWWTKLATRTNTCCTTFPVFLSLVLRLFLAYCHPNLCTQPFLCPSFGQRFFNVMLKYSTASAPPVTPSWIVAQVTKPTKNLLLALWTDHTTPLKSPLGSTKS